MNNLQWTRENHNHGELLVEELGHTIVYLHYNTGLHVSENGRRLAEISDEIKFKEHCLSWHASSLKVLAKGGHWGVKKHWINS